MATSSSSNIDRGRFRNFLLMNEMSVLRQVVFLVLPRVILKSLIHILFVIYYGVIATAQVVSYQICVIQYVILALKV